MKARILVLAVNDGDEYVELHSIASEATMDNNPDWIEKQAESALSEYDGTIRTYGFIDVEIPDAVIAQVLRRNADAGVIAAEAVES